MKKSIVFLFLNVLSISLIAQNQLLNSGFDEDEIIWNLWGREIQDEGKMSDMCLV